MERRDFLSGVLASGAGLATAQQASVAHAKQGAAPLDVPAATPTPAKSQAPARAEEVWKLLSPLCAGDSIGLGWRATHLSEVIAGACVLTLAHDETHEEARVHVCRRAGTARGVASSNELDFVLMNRADGSVPTHETLARVLNTLAELARRNEQQGARAPSALLTHEARLNAHEFDSSLT